MSNEIWSVVKYAQLLKVLTANQLLMNAMKQAMNVFTLNMHSSQLFHLSNPYQPVGFSPNTAPNEVGTNTMSS